MSNPFCVFRLKPGLNNWQVRQIQQLEFWQHVEKLRAPIFSGRNQHGHNAGRSI